MTFLLSQHIPVAYEQSTKGTRPILPVPDTASDHGAGLIRSGNETTSEVGEPTTLEALGPQELIGAR